MTEYELVVGIEIHAQLLTKSKLFCACPNRFGDRPNANTCPVCLAHPGVLPVVNRAAIEKLVKAGLALNCKVNEISRFARKNYFYPDLPKGYQISQYEMPVCTDGRLDVTDSDGKQRTIRIRRIHIEEDAGKLLHEGVRSGSLVDLNRAGTPLMEIVTEPDFRSVDEVYDFLTQLRRILRYLKVCDGNMEEGSMRCEPNISIRPRGTEALGVKVELKNINSFKAARRGIEYEVIRQTLMLDRGEKLRQETRGWDENKEESFLMRVKEDAHDYRYFPDPDLPPLKLDSAWIEEIRKTTEELPRPRKERIIKEYGLNEADADVLCSEFAIIDYFETAARKAGDGKLTANWVMGEVLRAVKAGGTIESFPVRPDRLAELVKLIRTGRISSTIAKKVFELMLTSPNSPEAIVEAEGLGIVSDEKAIAEAVALIISENPEQVRQFLEGKDKVMGFLVGQGMKKMKGKADPAILNRLMKEAVEKSRA
ncbi:MAG: Asp-tRNA(Asn)/Glu-tRNA(Gln) amidotransferase subunit GatB [Candidatus Riflebacteria bacterium]|nr:Asp-tRNA(Asn)/Glu-tRNA(Gln) amidotransferase subunit GatB [Candidatus Riflebacteria bacterium]